MNEKNIKKQPSAQALGADSLENVAGGVSKQYGYGGGPRDDLSVSQKQTLEKYGITVQRVDDGIPWGSFYHQPGHYLFTDKYGNEVSDAIITKLLS